jgi:hypothetical protein
MSSTEKRRVEPPPELTGDELRDWFRASVFADAPEHRGWMHTLGLFVSNWLAEFELTLTVDADGTKVTCLEEKGLLWIAIKFTQHPGGEMEMECQRDELPYGVGDNPAIVEWHPNGTVAGETFYYGHQIHACGRPAVVAYYDNGMKCRETWFCRGKVNNGTEPASIWYNLDGSIHRRDWFVDGKLARVELSAV